MEISISQALIVTIHPTALGASAGTNISSCSWTEYW